jgi:hypothetical protein
MSSWYHGSDVHNVKSPRLLSVRDSEDKIVALCTDINEVKLIAAAPDLLKALQDCLDEMESLRLSGDAGFWEWEDGDVYSKGVDAVIKATGGMA